MAMFRDLSDFIAIIDEQHPWDKIALKRKFLTRSKVALTAPAMPVQLK